MTSISSELSQLTGPVLRPGDDGYDTERTGFQLAAAHHPDLIVAAVTSGDVQTALAHAAARGLPVAVQASGHGLATAATGGVLVSTRHLTGLHVDPEARTVRAEAGARWKDVITAAAAYGLAPLNGSAPDVGVAGYTLGGGLGLLAREFGYACDHVRSIDVVTPDGRVRHVTPDIEPDLFWALRGARDNFGVVTALEIGLLPVTRVYGGGLYHEAGAEALEAWHAWTAGVPEELTSSLALIPYPDVPGLPEPLRGRHIAHIRVACTGTYEEGERLVAPLRAALGPALIDTLTDLPYTESASIYSDPPDPHAYHGTNALVTSLDPATLKTIFDLSPATVVQIRHLGGALSRTPPHPSAVGFREADYLISALAGDPAGPKTIEAELAPITIGRFLNYLYGMGTEDVASAYEPATYQRLRDLKAAHDPANRFHANHNIPPA